MSLIFCSRTDDPDEWRAAFAEALPDLEFRIWPDVGEAREGEVALVWDPMQEQLLRFPNLKLIASLGAGVDHLLATTTLPDGVPMTRIVDGNLTQGMREYVLLQTLFCHRQVSAYMAQQQRQVWRQLGQPFAQERCVGIMGRRIASGRRNPGLPPTVDAGYGRHHQLPDTERFAAWGVPVQRRAWWPCG